MDSSEIEKYKAVNAIYDTVFDIEKIDSVVSRIFKSFDNNPNSEILSAIFNRAYEVAKTLDDHFEVDLSRDIGVIVLGINSAGIVTTVPLAADKWLKARFVGNKTGIGWTTLEDGQKFVSHRMDSENTGKLPIDPNIRQSMAEGRLKNLIVVHSFEVSETATQALADLYALTPTEIEVSIQLSQGLTLAEIADERKVSRETIKSQLKNIYQKTGVNRQTKLVRLLTQIFAAAAIHARSQENKISPEPDWRNGLVSLGTLFAKSTRGERICYSKYGDPEGRPVIYIHHGVGSRWHSRKMAEACKKHGLLMIKPDRPGYGHSDPLLANHPKFTAEFYSHLLEANEIDRAEFIGFGTGGRLFLEAAPHFKDRIEEIKLWSFMGGPDLHISEEEEIKGLGMAALQWAWKHPNVMRGYLRLVRTTLPNQEKAARNLKKHYTVSESDSRYMEDDYLVKNMLSENRLSGRQDFLGTYNDHLAILKPFPELGGLGGIPVSLFYGLDDHFAKFEPNRPTLNSIEHWSHYAVAGEGQLFPNGNFDKFLSVMINKDQHSDVSLIESSK